MNIHTLKKRSSGDGFSVIDTSGFTETVAVLREAVKVYSDAKIIVEKNRSVLCGSWKGAGGEQFAKAIDSLCQSMTDNVDSLVFLADRLELGGKNFWLADEFGSSSLNAVCQEIVQNAPSD